jgi:hypothetical protein
LQFRLLDLRFDIRQGIGLGGIVDSRQQVALLHLHTFLHKDTGYGTGRPEYHLLSLERLDVSTYVDSLGEFDLPYRGFLCGGGSLFGSRLVGTGEWHTSVGFVELVAEYRNAENYDNHSPRDETFDPLFSQLLLQVGPDPIFGIVVGIRSGIRIGTHDRVSSL